MWIGGSSKIARTAEVLLRVQAGLFGSGSAGLGVGQERLRGSAPGLDCFPNGRQRRLYEEALEEDIDGQHCHL